MGIRHRSVARCNLKRAFSAACILAFLSQQGFAQIVVTNDDSGGVSGSLSWAVAQAAATPNSTIEFSGTDGNIEAGSPPDVLAVSNTPTLNAAGTTALNIPDAITLTGRLTVDMGGANGAISGAISDGSSAGALSVQNSGSGGGVLTLSGDNTYSGGTIVTSGVSLQMGAQNALGTGSVVLNSADLNLQGFSQSIGSLSGDADSTIELGVGTLTIDQTSNSAFQGVISDGGAGGSLVKNGLGTLTLDASQNSLSNAYSGGTTINEGILRIYAWSDLGTGSLTFNGGTLQTATGINLLSSITLSAGGGTIDTDGKSSTIYSNIFGTGGLTVTDSVGGGSLTLMASNGYEGGTTLGSQGLLSVDSDSELGNASGAIYFNGGTLQANSNNAGGGLTTSRQIQVLSGGGTFDANGLSSIFQGALSGSGALSVVDSSAGGGGVLALSGNNSGYSGALSVTGATLEAGNSNALGTGTLSLSAATFRTLGSSSFGNNVSLNGAATIDAAGVNAAFSGVVSGSGALTLEDLVGGGSISLSGDNTYSGGTTVSNAAVVAGNNSSFGTGGVSFTGGSLSLSNVTQLSNGITLNGSTTLSTSGSTTMSGVISEATAGAGVLVLNGGNFNFTANNSYTGGLAIGGNNETIGAGQNAALGGGSVSIQGTGDVLQATSSVNLGNSISLSENATVDANGQGLTLSGVISGGDNLLLEDSAGGGSITLSGSNSGYTGTTTVANGTKVGVGAGQAFGTGGITLNNSTLQAQTDISVGNAITLNGAAIFDANAFSPTFSGTISGGGSLTLTDSEGANGLITLSGTNTYTGQTTIDGSNATFGQNGVTVSVGTLDALGTGALVLKGGANGSATLLIGADQGVGSLSGDANSHIQMINSLLSVGSNNSNTTYAGSISDLGGSTLFKTGTGTLNLSGAWSVDTTEISQGTLQLGANSSDSGDILVDSNATFDLNGFSHSSAGALTNNGGVNLGAGTLTVGSYSGTGTLSLIPQTAAFSVQVTNTANVASQTLYIQGRPSQGDYKIITAGTLVTNSGSFSSIVLPSGYVAEIDPLAPANQFILELQTSGLSHPSQSSNEQSIGNMMTNASFNATGDLANVVNQLYGMSPSQLSQALDQMSPVSLGAMSGMSYAGASVQTAGLRARTLQLAEAEDAPKDNAQARGPSPYPGTLVADSSGIFGPDSPFKSNSASGSCLDASWGIFASALATIGKLNSASGSAGSEPGYSFHSGGGQFGADCRWDEQTLIGIAGGYLRSSSNIDSGAGYVDDQSLKLGAYGAYDYGEIHTDVYAGGALDLFDTSRNITLLGRTATASPNGKEANLDVQTSYALDLSPWGLAPYVGFAYDRLTVDPFTENGAGAVDLSVSQQTATSARSRLGAKVSRRFDGKSFIAIPYASLGWQHEWENQSRAIDAQLASGAGGAFSVTTAPVSRDGALLGLGMDVQWTNVFSTRLAYAGDIRSDYVSHEVSGSMRWQF